VQEKVAPAAAPRAGEEHLPPVLEGEPAMPLHEPVAGGAGGEGGMRPPGGGAPPPPSEEPLFQNITDAEIDALFEPAASVHMVQVEGEKALDQSFGLRLPGTQGGEGPFVDPATGKPLHKEWVIDPATGKPVHKYWGVDPATGMTVQEYKFLTQRGLPPVDREGNPILGPRCNKMTKMRIHSPDPTAPEGSASRRGWTMNFEQGENLRMTADGTWFDKRYGKLPDTSDFDVRPFRRGPAGEWVEAAT
jgi:hypothetical protein